MPKWGLDLHADNRVILTYVDFRTFWILFYEPHGADVAVVAPL
jgi:hypothetical protein